MKPTEWIIKHKHVWQRWPRLSELVHQFPNTGEGRLAVILRNIKARKQRKRVNA